VNPVAAVHGLLAEFSDPAALLRAARATHGAGYRRVEAYSPMQIEGLVEALGSTDEGLPRLALVGGIVGGVLTYAMQWLSVTYSYPLNVGGRTPAWPGLIPATFEMTVLGAVLAVFFGVLLRSGLPRLYHPVFNDAGFAAASSDGFFLCIDAADPHYDPQRTHEFLESLEPVRVTVVDA
jgi:hypothetical protein